MKGLFDVIGRIAQGADCVWPFIGLPYASFGLKRSKKAM